MCSFAATTERYRFDFRLFGLVGASLRWLVLRLSITVVNPFYYDNAERLRIHIKIYRQTKLSVLDAHGIQMTRLYLKYNALYYIATIVTG